MNTEIARKPRTLTDTGLKRTLIEELIAKHLHEGGAADLPGLVARLGLSGNCVEEALGFMREEGRVELRRRTGDLGPHYVLTDKGHEIAKRALENNRYVGPAPVPLDQYIQVVRAQSPRDIPIGQEAVRAAFADAVIGDEMLELFGPAVQSGRAVFLYGPPGTGKSFLGKKLAGLFQDKIFVPRAISVGDVVIPFFDPSIHKQLDDIPASSHALFSEGYDARYVICQRPMVITGGELTLDMLEIRYDSSTQLYRMPVHFLANNGLFMIDDLGRHQFSPADLLNRWIVPMEERRDYLYISGQHFEVAFHVVLLFATNMNPLELADEAFLRRIGYKIKFSPLSPESYAELWKRVSDELGVSMKPELIGYLQEQFHGKSGVPLLPSIPRDLLNIIADYNRYYRRESVVTEQALRWAWDAYFVRLD